MTPKTIKTSFYQDKRHYFTTEQQNHYYKAMSPLQWLDLQKWLESDFCRLAVRICWPLLFIIFIHHFKTLKPAR